MSLNEFDNPRERTENYKEYADVMSGVSLSTLVKALNYIRGGRNPL